MAIYQAHLNSTADVYSPIDVNQRIRICIRITGRRTWVTLISRTINPIHTDPRDTKRKR